MRVLVAPDSFKDALPATAVCTAIAAGLRRRNADISIAEFPLADGGEGTGEILNRHLGLETLTLDTVDPLLRPIQAQVGLSRDKHIAVIELAQASGLQRLRRHERNPLHTGTQGTGRLLAEVLKRGARRVVLGIGGSATNDAGIGLAVAMGWRFLDSQDRDVAPTGKDLQFICKIVPPTPTRHPQIDVLCDVTNPLFGSTGAAYAYGEQKGASNVDIEVLDAGLRHIAALIAQQKLSEVAPETPGAGAAGGVGYGAMVFLRATVHRGIEYVLETTKFDAALAGVDLIITGEGHLDSQTAQGKTIGGVCKLASRHGIPVIALCGRISATDDEVRAIGLRAAYCINEGGTAGDVLPRTAERLTAVAARIAF